MSQQEDRLGKLIDLALQTKKYDVLIQLCEDEELNRLVSSSGRTSFQQQIERFRHATTGQTSGSESERRGSFCDTASCVLIEE